jgi:ribosomal silencing factor RsfS
MKKRLVMSREEKKTYILSKYPTNPDEYLIQQLKPQPKPNEEARWVNNYELNRMGLAQLIKDEMNVDLEFIKVPEDRGLPFNYIAIVESEHRRVRLALMDRLMRTFKSLGPVSDYNKKVKEHNKGQKTSTDEDWIIVNLPRIAAIHIMHPEANVYYNLKELYT